MSDVQIQILQFFSRPRPPIALQAKPMLLMNMGPKHLIIALSLAHWTYRPSTEPTRRDLPDTAEKFHGPNFFAAVNEGEPHRLWPAKKSLGTLLCNALTVTGSPPFLTLPSPRAEA